MALTNVFLADSAELGRVVSGFRDGFELGYEGPRSIKWKTSEVPDEPELGPCQKRR